MKKGKEKLRKITLKNWGKGLKNALMGYELEFFRCRKIIC